MFAFTKWAHVESKRGTENIWSLTFGLSRASGAVVYIFELFAVHCIEYIVHDVYGMCFGCANFSDF